MWNHVIRHFEGFLGELELEPDERADAEGKAERVAKSLFAKYYPNQEFYASSYAIVGSYGKGTATRPPTDLDMIFKLPWDVYTRIQSLERDKQSQLLQEIRRTLRDTFWKTDVSADGPAVIAPFETYNVDVVPGFECLIGDKAGQYLIPFTSNDGYWGYTNPVAEYTWLHEIDVACGTKATHLIKMLKAWKRECNVELKSVCMEIAAAFFVNQWKYRNEDIFYYDWMVRDFFEFMLNYVNGSARPAGNDKWIPLGDGWESKCRTAYSRALKACDHEYNDAGFAASSQWQDIFGDQFQLDWAHAIGIGA